MDTKMEPKPTRRGPNSTRWVGSLVADGHRTLIRGGIFSYPGDRVNKNGKLRLLYEAYPFAFIFGLQED